ncbi:MAG: hypothetical protein IPM12_14875 [Flavobacteriales bacterium]|nr:hypothetical protein [Flavobacteriales bacterium]
MAYANSRSIATAASTGPCITTSSVMKGTRFCTGHQGLPPGFALRKGLRNSSACAAV